MRPVGAPLGGHFTIDALLTSDGETARYRVRDRRTDQPALVGVTAVTLAPEAAGALLWRLDRLAPRLLAAQHPNLGRYLEHGRLPDGALYLASALPEGVPASVQLKSRSSVQGP